MNFRKPNFETILFILAFLLGLFLRFFKLGEAPLSEMEASWALHALQVARPGFEIGRADIASQPAYIFLTAASFMLFSASTFIARFWPALTGSLLILLPVFFRRQLGRPAALILGFGLAIDPGLVTVSRQAGGPMMALAFSLLALCFWSQRKSIIAGILAGLALLCGPQVITGALGLGLAWLLLRYLFPERQSKQEQASLNKQSESTADAIPDEQSDSVSASVPRALIFSAIATLLIAGTLFFRYPEGLGAWFNTLPDYLNGWVTYSGTTAAKILASLAVFQPFALIFSLVAAVRWVIDWRNGQRSNAKTLAFLFLWTLLSLLLILIYPARQVSDLVWTLVPLWTIASIELSRYLPEEEPLWIALLEAGLILLLAVLFWNTLVATNRIAPSPEIPWDIIQIAVLVGIIALGALTTILIGLGWSWEGARVGLVWGLALVFTVYAFSGIWGASQLRANQPHELWSPPPGTGQAGLMSSTLTDLSNWTTGFPTYINVVSAVDAPSIRWMLRDFPNASFAEQPPVGELPDIIITRQEQEIPALSASYRGQDFVWWVWPGWQGAVPVPVIEWITFREAPLVNEHIILWARSDLFPGGALEPAPELIESE